MTTANSKRINENSAWFKLNEFADWTEEEFSAILGSRPDFAG